jgi:hypothetical protein
MTGSGLLRGLLLSLLALAGPLWAGDASVEATALESDPREALVAEYTVRDARGERTLVLVRDAERVEYRIQDEHAQDEPIQLWRQTADGIAHLELFPQERRSIAYAPGDLRTLDRVPQWTRLTGLIDPALLTRLRRTGSGHAFDEVVTRHRGDDANGGKVALDWLEADSLPAYFRSGTGDTAYVLRLRKLQRIRADAAFTSTADYREVDYADLGDMELDPFVARYLRRHGHAEH